MQISLRCVRSNYGNDIMKECPNCKLANPDSAMTCDCGFDFTDPEKRKALKPVYVSRHYVFIAVL